MRNLRIFPFGLYAASDLTAADGSIIPEDGLLEVVSVAANENGGFFFLFLPLTCRLAATM